MAWPDPEDGRRPEPERRASPAGEAVSVEEPRAYAAALAEVRQAALREGEAAGRARALAEVQPVLEQLAHTVADLAKLRPRLREQAEEDLVRLAVAIARRVVHRELTLDPQTITGLVKAALEQLAAGERIRLRVYPDHEAPVRAYLEAAGRASVEVVGDRG